MTYGPEQLRRDLDVSRETIERLEKFRALLAKWQKSKNLVAASTLEDFWHRHILDSGQLIRSVPGWTNGSWIDFGSGAGFPGLVMSILRPADALPIHLVESNRKKCQFLKEVSRICSANVTIVNDRIENVSTLKADIVSARACAPLPLLLEWAVPCLNNDGVCAFLKGQDVEEELTEAHKYWNMRVEEIPSLSHDHGKVLLIGDVQRV